MVVIGFGRASNMVLVWIALVILCFLLVAGRRRVLEAIRLGVDLLDLVKLLVTLKVKAARVRGIDW